MGWMWQRGLIVNDYLSLLPATLQWVSQLLDSASPIPWPLWIGMLLPIYLGALTLLIWFLRGGAWPVRCDYPRTQRGGPCRNTVAGEWRRCKFHNHVVTYKYGHTVKPWLRRWQTLTRSNKVVDAPEKGVGVFRLRPRGGTLLYKNGYARRPTDAAGEFKDFKRGVKVRIQSMRLRLPPEDDSDLAEANRVAVDTSVNLSTVVQATRFATVSMLVALLLSALGPLFSGQVQSNIQWLATLAFVLAWAASYSGIFQGRSDWRGNAAKKAAKWWVYIFVPVAVANLFFAAVNKSPT